MWTPQQLTFYARHSHETDPAWYACLTAGSSGWPDEVANAIPSQLKCPVHVAYGDPAAGGLVTPEDVAALATAGVNLTSTHFPGAPHTIAPNFTRELRDDLKAWLATL